MTVAEKPLANIDQTLGTVLDAAPVGFILIDSEGMIKHFNKYSETLFGFSKKEIINKQLEVLLPDQFREAHVALRDSFINEPWPRMMGVGRELFAQRKDGSQFPIEIGLGPVEIDGDLFITAVVIDITEKLQLEAQQKSRLEQSHYEELMALSSPLLSVWKGIKVLPLIGTLDSMRTQDAMEKALTCMAEEKVRVLIVDITGVLTVDTMVSDHLIRMATAVRLMGGDCILTGISPEVARTVTTLGVDLSTLHTRATLADGLELGIKVIEQGVGMQS